MPSHKSIEKLKHPNSRKTQWVAKKQKRVERRQQIKQDTFIKQNLIAEKILWFKERIPQGCAILTKEQTLGLVELYLKRFDEEISQIELKNSIGKRKNRQHANRLDVINLTKTKEIEEFTTCGLEIPNLTDSQQLDVLKNWNGELRYLQNFKLKRFAKQK